jgi:hypothetical protein
MILPEPFREGDIDWQRALSHLMTMALRSFLLFSQIKPAKKSLRLMPTTKSLMSSTFRESVRKPTK